MTQRPFILGLTGSIGMGKSTTAAMFAQAGVPVWDADAAVHRLYAKGGAGAEAISTICPEAISDDGVDRAKLRSWIAKNDDAISRIEALIHPLVAKDRAAFIAKATGKHDLVLVDIPLLFETGGANQVDSVVVVSAPSDEQRRRVLARVGMTEAHFAKILAAQLPDVEKRARADYVIETTSLDVARQAVADILTDLKNKAAPDA